MTANDLRQLYLDFFKSKGHAIIPSASLIPENDPTVLFTTAGMHPLVPYLMGEKHPSGQRLVNCQKCIRTSDIDEVGDNRHLTFFEMLGNWSLGDYFKKEAIEWSWEFLFDKKWLGMDSQRLYVTVFMGDKELGLETDEKSIKIWQECFKKAGITAEVCPYNTSIGGNKNYRIFPLPAKDNFWGPAGTTGPCGPCTEMFYDVSPEKGALQKTFDEEMNVFRIMEVWNDVFMEFNKKADGQYKKLPTQNVDTGMGLERTVSVLNGKQDAFDNELFYPLIQKIEELSGKKYNESVEVTRAMRIIADHIKAAVFIIADGVTPEKSGSGYVLRRLIRRARYYYDLVGASNRALGFLVECVAPTYKDVYPELLEKKNSIEKIITDEEDTFVGHLMFGKRLLEKIIEKEKYISDDDAFLLYSTYGFPFELILDIAKEKNIEVDVDGFNKKRMAHQELSRTASAGMFKGGLADASEETIKYHTAAHLMLAALRRVLGKHVVQRGSNITLERLRFDFSHSEKMTPEQIKQVEDLVNEKIKADLPVGMSEMTLDEAKAAGAMGVFESKYGEKVKVYSIGDFSKEICGGPHAERTGALGRFKIAKEESSSAGVRRIKATLD